MWDFANVQFVLRDLMRYDTPGDYQGDEIVAWSGLAVENPLYARAVQLHEFNERIIVAALGITDEMIDVIDKFRLLSWEYPEGRATLEELGVAAIEYAKIPKTIVDRYDEAHFIVMIHERLFVEACGLDWKKYNAFIESTRGKIPIEPNQ